MKYNYHQIKMILFLIKKKEFILHDNVGKESKRKLYINMLNFDSNFYFNFNEFKCYFMFRKKPVRMIK